MYVLLIHILLPITLALHLLIAVVLCCKYEHTVILSTTDKCSSMYVLFRYLIVRAHRDCISTSNRRRINSTGTGRAGCQWVTITVYRHHHPEVLNAAPTYIRIQGDTRRKTDNPALISLVPDRGGILKSSKTKLKKTCLIKFQAKSQPVTYVLCSLVRFRRGGEWLRFLFFCLLLA